MTAASPLEVLWAVDGRPPLPSANTAGVCAATGAQADVVPLKAGLPSSFNSQHLLRFAGPTAGVSASMHHAMTTWGPVRCADSRWKNSGLMALVIDDHNVTEVTRWQGDPFTVADLLDDLHLLDAMAIVAPTTRKKHSTLWAQFGHVATESGPERFTAPLIAATRAVRDAKAAGVTEGELREPEPTFRAVGLLGGIAASAAVTFLARVQEDHAGRAAWHVIAGLPGQRPMESLQLGDVVRSIAKRLPRSTTRRNLSLHWQPFSPLPGTPMQWAAAGSGARQCASTLDRLKTLDRLNVKHVVGRTDAMSKMCAVIGRSDARAVRFFERSAPMTPDQAASATGSTYGPLDPDDPLPWDFVVTHHDRGFLVDRWRKRQAFLNQQVARR